MARFLLLTHIYPPAIDGGSRVIFKMGEYLKLQGHELLTITTNAYSTDDFTKPTYKKISYSQLSIYRFPAFTLFHRPFKFLGRFFPSFKTLAKGPLFSPLNLIKMNLLVRNFSPDFVLAGPLPTLIPYYALCLKASAPLILNASFHPSDPEFYTPLLVKTLKSADLIWTLTDHETAYFKQKFHIPSSRIIQLGNGVDPSFLKRKSSSKRKPKISKLLFIGSFAAHKGLSTLLQAFSFLPSRYRLTLAGQKTLYFPLLKKQLQKLPLSVRSRIKLTTNFSDKDLKNIIDHHHLLISPSTQESFGLVLIEAMARRKPVLAAGIPASAEIIKKSGGGIIFKTGDSQDLKNKILKMSSFKKSGFDYVSQNYTWDKVASKLCQKILK